MDGPQRSSTVVVIAVAAPNEFRKMQFVVCVLFVAVPRKCTLYSPLGQTTTTHHQKSFGDDDADKTRVELGESPKEP